MSQHANNLTVPILPDDERQQVPKTPIAKATPRKVWYLLICAILSVFGILAIPGLVERAIRSRAIIKDYDYFLEPLDGLDFDDYVVDDSILVNDMDDDGDDDASIAAFETQSFQESGTLVPMLEKAGALPLAKTESESSESSDEDIPTETESCDLSSEDCVRQLIKKYPVLLFTLEWWPGHNWVFELLDQIGIPRESIHIIDLDEYKSIGPDICANLMTISGQTYCSLYPTLFVGGEWTGDYRQTKELYDLGELEAKFRKAGVLPQAEELYDLQELEPIFRKAGVLP